ncbi:MAG: NUDIX hydrolase [Lachnospiraceae bacterium]|nr:NUDIX hydrolase [Lachnospiraceae bacterium]MDE6232615.1 NUDIX hydrolase [Lachnospiraceae bacterium]MDE6254123.1 NUDIX hydrolase [Lachnospiraceae bacterium]
MEEIRRINRELVYKGHIIDMYKDTVEIPNGNVAEWDFIGHKGAAAVIPVTNDGKILMVRQYRNALDRYTVEIPAGGLENKDEPMIKCAARELEEETGYKSDNLEFLLSLRTTVAFCNEKIEVFLARNLKKTKQHLDEDEYIDVVSYDVEELVDMIYAGKIEDSKTVAAVLAYYAKYLHE